MLKGILSAADATLAALHGADAIVVSNHGGRQLDGAPGTLHCLPAIAAAVQRAAAHGAARPEIYIDGGVRRGADAIRAIALGARAVLVGRPVLWGLAVAGEPGVARVLRMLEEELVNAMQLCGIRSLADIGPHTVRRLADTARL